jgi:hypothetical protein
LTRTVTRASSRSRVEVGVDHQVRDVRRQAALHQCQLDAADVIAEKVLDHAEGGGQGQHLAGLGSGVDQRVDGMSIVCMPSRLNQ